MAHEIECIVRRSSADEFTFAIVVATVPDEIRHGTQLLKVIMAAVTDWIDETEDGRACYKISSEDFNIGDLAHNIGDPSLGKRLRKHGIQKLEITCYCHTQAEPEWTYDTHLYAGNGPTRDEEAA